MIQMTHMINKVQIIHERFNIYHWILMFFILGLSDSHDLHGSNIPQGLYVPQDLDDLVQMVNIVQMIYIFHLIWIVHVILIVHMIYMT